MYLLEEPLRWKIQRGGEALELFSNDRETFNALDRSTKSQALDAITWYQKHEREERKKKSEAADKKAAATEKKKLEKASRPAELKFEAMDFMLKKVHRSRFKRPITFEENAWLNASVTEESKFKVVVLLKERPDDAARIFQLFREVASVRFGSYGWMVPKVSKLVTSQDDWSLRQERMDVVRIEFDPTQSVIAAY